MERLRQADLQALLTGVRQVYADEAIHSFPTVALTAVRGLIPGVRYGYAEIDLRQWRGRVIAADPPESISLAIAQAAACHMHEHPLINHYTRTRDGHACKISDFLSLRQFRRLGLYEDVYRPIGAVDQLSINLETPGAMMIGIGINRDRANFTKRDLLLFDLLRPHLAQAYENARRDAAMRRVLAVGTQPVIAVDGAGAVRFGTDAAWQIVAAHFGMSPRAGKALPVALRAWVRQQQAHLLCSDDAPPPFAPLTLENARGRLVVRFVPGTLGEYDDLLVFAEEQRELSPARLAPLGLTPREAEVLVWVARGQADAEIGATLGMSTRTVQKHLEHIYRKLGVESRTAATARVLALAQAG